MLKYWSITFLDYAGERALKTIIQALFAAGVLGESFLGLDWAAVASISAGMFVASVLTSVLFYRGDGSDNPDDTSVGPASHDRAA
ncbi:holin [Pseudoclavibacter sp. AY1H1]|uniref:holin n=1 Tax=Pseudoclavibacter sp. AY1H1 TaxID=2080584 RepID=UPI000CE72880|nr:holin [Pseudoclavibacter sp. AY1H1]PPF36930.1 Holin [Pseudoclavibacter sp. AY1H1]